MARTILPLGRVAEHVASLGVDPRRIMVRDVGNWLNGMVEIKVASSDLYVRNVLDMQSRGPSKPTHWRSYAR